MPATPATWLSTFQVNSGTAAPGFQIEPQVIQLASGNIVVAWTDASDNVDDDFGLDIIAAIYNPLGELVRAPFQLNPYGLSDESQFDLLAQPNGGFALVHEQVDTGGVGLIGSIFDADGDAVSPNAFVRVGGGVATYNDPTMTCSAIGTLLYAFQRTEGGVTETRVMLRNSVTPQEHVAIANSSNETTGSSVKAVSAAALGNGTFVVVAQGAGANNTIMGRLIDSGGTPTGSEFVIGSSGTNGRDNFGADVVALEGGGFVVAWSGETGSDTELYYQRYNDAGVAQGTTFVVANDGANDSDTEASVTALPDGGFMISWRDGETNSISAQRFDESGTKVGDALTIATTASSAEVTALEDGRIALVWNQGTNIHMQILDTRDTVNGAFYTGKQQIGLAGDDVFTGADDAKIVHGADGNDTITTSDVTGIRYFGDAGNDTVLVTNPIGGGADADHFNGGDGIDTIDWSGMTGMPNAWFRLDQQRAYIISFQESIVGFENLIGTNTVDNIVGDDGANVLEGRDGRDDISGGDGDDTLVGGNHDDTLDGGAGADLLDGGAGNDIYVVDGLDTIVETSGNGTDAVEATADFTLAAGVDIELLRPNDLFGSVAFNLTGNEIGQRLTGNYGANTLDGRGGNDDLHGVLGDDVLIGGDGDDRLVGGAGADVLNGGDGFDRVTYAGAEGVRIVLGAGTGEGGEAEGDTLVSIEWVDGTGYADELIGTGATERFYGNLGDDIIDGGGGDDQINGGDGDDILTGGAGADQIAGNGGVDTVLYVSSPAGVTVNLLMATGSGGDAQGDTFLLVDNVVGSAHADTLTGNSFDNVLDGGAGDDTLAGGHGNDIFIVDSAGDAVVETSSGGDDRVKAGVSYVLTAGAHVEQLTTVLGSATDAIDLTGNALAQEIIGNYGDNVLADGPAGGAADHLRGLSGSDTYRVFNPATTIVESSAQGDTDRVKAAVDYQLGAGVHVEQLTTILGSATDAIDLRGNTLAQEIIGNYGDNVLHDGGAGAGDHLRGLSGNDTYRVFNADTTITESAAQGAADKVIAAVNYTLGAGVHIETLQTNAGAGTGNLRLTGNEFEQTIIGNNGDNRLEGKGGNDVLRGLGGNDTFVFADALGPDNVDTILDFDPADDRFLLSNNVFSGFGERTGAILPGHLRVDTTGEAQDASDMIIYDSDDGFLYYDADGFGSGARIHFATIDPGLAVTNSDFVLA